jgi:two-component system chemotaxis response regulator CheY
MSEYILVVDDSPTVRAAAEFALKEKGFNVKTAENGIDGLSKLESIHVEGNKTSMIISDINMPEMDGFTFIRTVKKSSFKTIPILVLTTESQKSVKMAGKETGAVDWLVKPFTPDQLENVIKKFVTQDEGEGKPAKAEDVDKLLHIFSDEMSELIPQIERKLERFGDDLTNTQLIESLIRMVHHLRISASFTGCEGISKFVYAIEEHTFKRVIDKKVVAKKELVSILATAVNVVKKMILTAVEGNVDKDTDGDILVDMGDVESRLKRYLDEKRVLSGKERRQRDILDDN